MVRVSGITQGQVRTGLLGLASLLRWHRQSKVQSLPEKTLTGMRSWASQTAFDPTQSFYTSLTRYGSVIHQRVCLQRLETKPSSNYWDMNYLFVGCFQLTSKPSIDLWGLMPVNCKILHWKTDVKLANLLNWSMRTTRPLTFIITCYHSLLKELRVKTGPRFKMTAWTPLFECNDPSGGG